jgi:hypothetical protein
MPDEGNVGHVALESGPLDCFKSGVPRRQYVIDMILNDVVGDRTSIAVTLGSGLDEYVGYIG